MTREIKFRGDVKWIDAPKKRWAYGDLIKIGDQRFIFIEEVGGIDSLEMSFMDNLIEVIPETVGQYAGKKDNNNTEIYENDNISFIYEGYEEFGTIEYCDGTFKIKVTDALSVCLCQAENISVINDLMGW